MCARYWTRIIGYVTRQWRVSPSSPLLSASVTKLETSNMKPFAISYFPINSVSEVSMREQGQARLPRTDSIHVNCKRVCKSLAKRTRKSAQVLDAFNLRFVWPPTCDDLPGLALTLVELKFGRK